MPAEGLARPSAWETAQLMTALDQVKDVEYAAATATLRDPDPKPDAGPLRRERVSRTPRCLRGRPGETFGGH